MDNENSNVGATFTPLPPNSVRSSRKEVSLSEVGVPAIRDYTVKVTVQRVHVEGVERTKNDVIVQLVKPLFDAKNFEEMVKISHLAKEQFEMLGLFKSCTIHIDVARGENAKPDGYDITYNVKESRRVTGGISTLVGTNEGSLLLSCQLPNAIGRGERISSEFTRGSKSAVGWSLNFSKPLFANPNHNFQLGLFQNSVEFPWSSYKELDRGLASDFSFVTGKHSRHSIHWEGVWRDLSCLTRSTAFSIREQSGPSLKSAVKHVWVRDTRDSRVLPNTGHLIKVSNEVAGFGGDVNYWKHETELQASKQLAWDSVIQLSLSGGVMNPIFSGTRLNVMDKFFLGGPLTFRGFQMKGVGPHEEGCALGANAYWCSGLHLYTPLPFRPGKGGFGEYFRTHFFVNAGNLVNTETRWRQNASALADSLRLSYGAGIVLRLGAIARLEVNYCVPAKAQTSDKLNPGLQFGVGVTFL